MSSVPRQPSLTGNCSSAGSETFIASRNSKGTTKDKVAWRSSLPLRRSCVDDVRGKELLACLELVRDRATSEPLLLLVTDSPLPPDRHAGKALGEFGEEDW